MRKVLITNASRLGDFFSFFFFLPKIVPKVDFLIQSMSSTQE